MIDKIDDYFLKWCKKHKIIALIVFSAILILLGWIYLLYSYKTGYDFECGAVLRRSQDILNGNILLKDWHATSVMGAFTTNLTSMLGILIFGFKDDALYFAGALTYLLLILMASLLVLFGNNNRYSITNLFILWILIIIPSPKYFDLFIRTERHVETYVICLVAFFLMNIIFEEKYRLLQNKSKNLVLFLYVIAIFMLSCSDNVSLFLCVLPISGTLFIKQSLFYLKGKSLDKFEIFFLFLTLTTYIFSRLFLKIANGFGYFMYDNTVNGSFLPYEELATSVSHSLRILMELFNGNFFGKPIFSIDAYKTIIGFIMFIFIMFIIVKTLKNFFQRDVVTQAIFLGGAIFITLYILTDVGIRYGLTEIPRYFVCPYIFLTIFIGRIGINEILNIFPIQWNVKNNKVLLCLLCIFCIVFFASKITTLPIEKSRTPYYSGDLYKLSEFLQEKHLKRGYSSYATSYILDVASEGKLSVVPVTFGSEPIVAQNVWYSKNTDYVEERNFIIAPLDRTDGEFSNIKDDYLANYFGQFKEKYQYENYTIWVWENNISTKIKPLFQPLYNIPVSFLNTNESCEKTSNYIKILPKGVQFGPYTRLPKGNYTVTAIGKDLDKGSFDVYSEQPIKKELISISNSKLKYKFFCNKDIERLEFNITNNSQQNIILEGYKIEKI